MSNTTTKKTRRTFKVSKASKALALATTSTGTDKARTIKAAPEVFIAEKLQVMNKAKIPLATQDTIVAQLHLIWNNMFTKLQTEYDRQLATNGTMNTGLSIRQSLDMLMSQYTYPETRKLVTKFLFQDGGLFLKSYKFFGLDHLVYYSVSMSPAYAHELTSPSNNTTVISVKHWNRYVIRASKRIESAKNRRTKDREKRKPGIAVILNRNGAIKAEINKMHVPSDVLSSLLQDPNLEQSNRDSIQKFLLGVLKATSGNNVTSQSYKYFTRFYCPLFSLKSTYRDMYLDEQGLTIVDLPACRASSGIALLSEPRILDFLINNNVTLESISMAFFEDENIPESDKAALMDITGKLLRKAIMQTPTGANFVSENETKSLLNALLVSDTKKLFSSGDDKKVHYAGKLSMMRRAIKELKGGTWLVGGINRLVEEERNSIQLPEGKHTHLPTLFFDRIEATIVQVFCDKQLKAGNFCVPFHDAIVVRKENSSEIEKEFVDYLVNEVHLYPTEAHFHGTAVLNVQLVPAVEVEIATENKPTAIMTTSSTSQPQETETLEQIKARLLNKFRLPKTTTPKMTTPPSAEPVYETSKHNNDDEVTNKLNKVLTISTTGKYKKELKKDIEGRVAYDRKVGPYRDRTSAPEENTSLPLLCASEMSDNTSELSGIRPDTERLLEAARGLPVDVETNISNKQPQVQVQEEVKTQQHQVPVVVRSDAVAIRDALENDPFWQ